MATTRLNLKHPHGILGWLGKIAGVAAGAGPLLELIEVLMTRQADKILRRLLGLAAIYLAMLAGIIIMVIGIAFLVIDLTSLPRGVAYALGGLLLVAGSAIFMQLSRK